jgi:hypothetical protein
MHSLIWHGMLQGVCAPGKIGNAKKESFQKWLFFLHRKHLEKSKVFKYFSPIIIFFIRETHWNMFQLIL